MKLFLFLFFSGKEPLVLSNIEKRKKGEMLEREQALKNGRRQKVTTTKRVSSSVVERKKTERKKKTLTHPRSDLGEKKHLLFFIFPPDAPENEIVVRIFLF